ncbi:hypothetical protein O2N63_03125 [Aliiroseovarius sp. KMU-50]|uniref:Uncharacterized protein n=1 Tax=Aliiroseovarius salicola TaxID=3009082 RepID=A0ABT4VZA9_9RHOB|nr:hypothetical protein [Aliiroseovarius sp. KMU-50]MDA5093070.1 hypothetical protein [Aliiroseovarius sp. KMU-50]
MEIGLLTSICAPRVKPSALLDLNFAAQTYRQNGSSVALSSVLTFSRASTAGFHDASGQAQTAAIDTPRFDHGADGQPRGLLIEHSSTNLIAPSDLGAIWTISGATNTSAPLTPDGLGARLITVNSGVNDCFLSRSASLSLGQAHTISVFCRRDLHRYVMFYGFGNGPAGVAFDLQTGASQINTSWSDVGIELISSEVARLYGTLSPAANGLFAVGPASGINGSKSFVGGEQLVLWGAQIEAGSSPSSHIPTTSTGVNRAADIAGIQGVSGVYDVQITYDDGTRTILTEQVLGNGWWPATLDRPHVKRLTIL